MIENLLLKGGDSFSEWQRSLWEKGPRADKRRGTLADRQLDLYKAVMGGKYAFLYYMETKLGINVSELSPLPLLPRVLTAKEAFDLPPQLEKELWEHFQTLDKDGFRVTPRLASQPLFWTLCYTKWIDQEMLDRDLVSVLTNKTVDRSVDVVTEKELDRFARNIMRNMGGLPSVRGSVSVFSNCPIARAWWRGYLATKVLDNSDKNSREQLNFEQVQQVLGTNPVWESLVGGLVQRVAVLNEPRAYSAIITYFVLHNEILVTNRLMVFVTREFARHGLIASFNLMPWNRMLDLVGKAVERFEDENRHRNALPEGEE